MPETKETKERTRPVRIYSNEHGAWWAPRYCGYRTDPAEAGVFEYGDAKERYPDIDYDRSKEDYFVDCICWTDDMGDEPVRVFLASDQETTPAGPAPDGGGRPMRTIVCRLDAVDGLHFPFQKECAGVRDYLKDHDEITVGSATQLLALDAICEKEGYRLEVRLPDGTVATNGEEGGMCPAHDYANLEFVALDAAGPDWKDGPR